MPQARTEAASGPSSARLDSIHYRAADSNRPYGSGHEEYRRNALVEQAVRALSIFAGLDITSARPFQLSLAALNNVFFWHSERDQEAAGNCVSLAGGHLKQALTFLSDPELQALFQKLNAAKERLDEALSTQLQSRQEALLAEADLLVADAARAALDCFGAR